MLANKTFNSKKAERAMAAAVVALAAIVVPGMVSTNLVSSAMADAPTADTATPNVSAPNETTQHVSTSRVSTLEDWQKLMPDSGNLFAADNVAKVSERFDAHQSILFKTFDTKAGKLVLQKWVDPADALFDTAEKCLRKHQYQQGLSAYFQAWKEEFKLNNIITSTEVAEENRSALLDLIRRAQMNNSSKVSGLGRIGG